MQSPCVRKCKLDTQGICLGCRRTLEEITRWAQLSDREREEIIKQLPERIDGKRKED